MIKLVSFFVMQVSPLVRMWQSQELGLFAASTSCTYHLSQANGASGLRRLSSRLMTWVSNQFPSLPWEQVSMRRETTHGTTGSNILRYLHNRPPPVHQGAYHLHLGGGVLISGIFVCFSDRWEKNVWFVIVDNCLFFRLLGETNSFGTSDM